MGDGYPFAGIVRNRESGFFVSIRFLEEKGASEDLINAIVHGTLELAVKLMNEWEADFAVEANPRLNQDEE